MKIYSLENIKRLKDNWNLYDIFYPMLKDNDQVPLLKYIVKENREMRLDLICMDIYGNTNFIDELMHINSIIDPYSVKKDDIIYYPSKNTINLFRKNYEGDKQYLKMESGLKDKYGKNKTPSTPVDNFKPVKVNKFKKEITIINKLN